MNIEQHRRTLGSSTISECNARCAKPHTLRRRSARESRASAAQINGANRSERPTCHQALQKVGKFAVLGFGAIAWILVIALLVDEQIRLRASHITVSEKRNSAKAEASQAPLASERRDPLINVFENGIEWIGLQISDLRARHHPSCKFSRMGCFDDDGTRERNGK